MKRLLQTSVGRNGNYGFFRSSTVWREWAVRRIQCIFVCRSIRKDRANPAAFKSGFDADQLSSKTIGSTYHRAYEETIAAGYHPEPKEPTLLEKLLENIRG